MIGSGASPLTRSESQSESNRSASSVSTISLKRSAVSARCAPSPYPIRTFICSGSRRTPRTCAARAGRSAACGPRRGRRRDASVRACVYMSASGQSCETPAAPNTWIARSMTFGRGAGREHLDRRDLEAGALVADGVHQPRGLHGQQAGLSRSRSGSRRPGPARHPGRPAACRTAGASATACTGARAPSRPARSPACSGGCGRGRGGPAPSRTRCPRHRGCSPAGSAHVLEQGLAVAAARVVAEHRQRAHDLRARRVDRDDDHRVAVVRVGVGIRHAHEDRELAAVRRRAARPPLVRVHDVVVAVALDAALDVRGVRARDPRLGHREARADLAFEQRDEPLVLLLGRPELGEDLHVAGVGRRAVRRLRRQEVAAHDLAERARSRRCSGPRRSSALGRKRFHSPRARASAFSSSITGGWKCGSPDSRTCSK